MDERRLTDKDGMTIYRINKTEARNRAMSGEPVGVCAVNLNPVNQWQDCCAWYKRDDEREAFDGYDTFDQFVNAYENYNCSHETGYYAAFYVEVKQL